MSKDIEERVSETIKATGTEVVAKPLGVKEYPKKSDSSEEDKEKTLKENTIEEWGDDSATSVRNGDVSESGEDNRDDSDK